MSETGQCCCSVLQMSDKGTKRQNGSKRKERIFSRKDKSLRTGKVGDTINTQEKRFEQKIKNMKILFT